jgi:hypothetical protein
MHTHSSTIALAALVLLHFLVTLLHGAAHMGAAVVLGPAALTFVIVVIEIGPMAGLAYMRHQPGAGALVVAGSMAAALLFGLVNHFLIAGDDHVSHVAARWRTLFASSAALLVLTEAAGVAVGLWCIALARDRAEIDVFSVDPGTR